MEAKRLGTPEVEFSDDTDNQRRNNDNTSDKSFGPFLSVRNFKGKACPMRAKAFIFM